MPRSPKGRCGEPGLVDRVLALHAGSQGSRGTCPKKFFRSNRPGYLHPVSSELEIVVSEWRSVITVSLNVGSGICLIKPAKLYMCMQNTTNTMRTDARRRCVCQWFRTAEPIPAKFHDLSVMLTNLKDSHDLTIVF